jgi:nucleotide-binding universal stress UspA family protein
MLAIKTILHPTDFSDRSGYAFDAAHALARDYGARLLVLHVRQPMLVSFGELPALPPEGPEPREVLLARLREWKPADPSVKVEYVLCEGDPATEILGIARSRGCDLIVMGTHGRTGLGRLLMGSVAEMVARKAPCPVFTLKTPFVEAKPLPSPEEAEPVGVGI